MEIIARSKFLRISPKKIRLVAKPITKMTPKKALLALKFSDKSVAYPLSKLINSAIANAKNNFGLSESDLTFQSIQVGPGPIYKRVRAAARGRAHPVYKRTANIAVILQGEAVKKATGLEKKIAQTLIGSDQTDGPKIVEDKKEITNDRPKTTDSDKKAEADSIDSKKRLEK